MTLLQKTILFFLALSPQMVTTFIVVLYGVLVNTTPDEKRRFLESDLGFSLVEIDSSCRIYFTGKINVFLWSSWCRFEFSCMFWLKMDELHVLLESLLDVAVFPLMFSAYV